jgi:hypothetical protein
VLPLTKICAQLQGNTPRVKRFDPLTNKSPRQQENFSKKKYLSHQQRNLDCNEMNYVTNEAQIEDLSDPLSMTS